MAIEHALNVLNWFENLPEEDRPPEYLWEDNEGLEQWWKAVENRRNDGASTDRGWTDVAQDSQDSKLVENDYARFLTA